MENQRQAVEQVVQDEGLAVKEPYQQTRMWSKKEEKIIDGLVFTLKRNML